VHYEKIAQGAPVNNRMEILRGLSLLADLDEVEVNSVASFQSMDKGSGIAKE
jgi:hypothetical protein